MKIAIIADTHFGVRGDSQVMLDHQKKFFDNIFFPTLEQHNIGHVIHLGDVVDRRTTINFNTVGHLRRDFLDPLNNNNITMDVICGNHDTYYKSTNQLNAFDTIFGDYRDSVSVYIDPVETQFGLFVPWMSPENYERSIRMITNSNSALCFGHLEINGFEMLRGIICDHGTNREIFENFDTIFSGHFHLKSSEHNIMYLGAPYQMTWGDFESSRGFHLFDTESRDLTYIENPYRLFIRLIYRGEDMDVDISDAYCKVVMADNEDPYHFDKFIQKLEHQQPADLKIVEPLTQADTSDIVGEAETTEAIVTRHIEMLDLSSNQKTKLTKFISELYSQALEIEKNS